MRPISGCGSAHLSLSHDQRGAAGAASRMHGRRQHPVARAAAAQNEVLRAFQPCPPLGKPDIEPTPLTCCSIGRVRSCVRPVCAAVKPLAIMLCAGRVPIRSSHSRCADPSGFSRSPERPYLHYLVMPSPIGSQAASKDPGSLYRSPCTMMAHAIRAILLAKATAATLVGRRAINRPSQGRFSVPCFCA